MLVDIDRAWKLTPKGEDVTISESVRVMMNKFSKRYKELRGDALVAEKALFMRKSVHCK